MLSCVCVVSVLIWAPCGLKMEQFIHFCVIMFFRKASPQTEGSRHAHLQIKSSPVGFRIVPRRGPREVRRETVARSAATVTLTDGTGASRTRSTAVAPPPGPAAEPRYRLQLKLYQVNVQYSDQLYLQMLQGTTGLREGFAVENLTLAHCVPRCRSH